MNLSNLSAFFLELIRKYHVIAPYLPGMLCFTIGCCLIGLAFQDWIQERDRRKQLEKWKRKDI